MKPPLFLLLPPLAFAAGFALHPSASSRTTAHIQASNARRFSLAPATPTADAAVSDQRVGIVPPRSLEEVLQIPGAYHRAVAARLYFDAQSPDEMPRILQEILARPVAPESDVIMNFFRSWGTRMPEAAGTAALSIPASMAPQDMAAAAARAWGRFAPEAARQWVAAHLDEPGRAQALSYLDGLESQRREQAVDPRERIQQALPTADQAGWAVLRRAFGEILDADPKEAARQFLAFPENRQFPNLASITLNGLLKTDAAAAMKFFAGLSPKNAAVSLRGMQSAMIPEAISAVRDYGLSLPAGETRTAMLGLAARTMVLVNRAEATAFVASLPPSERCKGMYDFWEINAASDPAKTAVDFVRTREEAGKEAASEIDAADMLRRGSMRFPEKGAQASLLLQPKERNQLLDSIAPQWVSRDPQAAFTWAAQVPDESARIAAIYKIAAHAAMHDATQVAQWAGELPAGPGRDGAARALAEQVFDQDPDSALTWTRSISTEAGRIAALRSAVNRWRWRNRTSTEEWLKSAPLSAEERAAFQAPNAESDDN